MGSDIHELIGADPTLLETEDLRRCLDEIIRWERRVSGARLRMMGELNRRNVWRHDGAGSAADWAATRLGSGARTARDQVDTAEKLALMPATADAVAAGDMSVEQAAALAAAVDEQTEVDFGQDEAELVEKAKQLPPGGVQRLAQRWRRDHTAREDEEQRHASLVERRSGRVYTNPDAMTVLQLESDPLSAASWRPVLEATIAMLWRQDRAAIRDATTVGAPAPVARTREQLLHDAFVWLVEHGRAGITAKGVTTPTQLVVVLRENTWGRLTAELLDGHPIPNSVIERLGLTADIIRCVVDAKGIPLDWGRAKRTATRDQRLALHLLYGGCVIPGCTAPFGSTEAHHRAGFNRNGEQGPTDMANLVPACFTNGHHHDLDTGRLKLRVNPDSSIDILTPDGRLIATRPAPTILTDHGSSDNGLSDNGPSDNGPSDNGPSDNGPSEQGPGGPVSEPEEPKDRDFEHIASGIAQPTLWIAPAGPPG